MRRFMAVFGTVVASVATLAGTAAAAPARPLGTQATCYATAQRHLVCGNVEGAAGFRDRSFSSPMTGRLLTTVSEFNCWGHGEPHGGGNDIWYWALLDTTLRWGNVPAVSVYTTQDPFPGVAEC